MLNVVLGRDRIERSRSVALLATLLLAGAALLQLQWERSSATVRDRDEAAVQDVSRAFAVALTTYDYAHPDVQLRHLEQLADPSVVGKVQSTAQDLVRSRASAVGEATRVSVTSLNGDAASTIVEVRETMSNSFLASPREASAVLTCELRQLAGGGWRIRSFDWLAIPLQPS